MIRDGLRVYERLEDRVAELGADQLTAICLRLIHPIRSYTHRVATGLRERGYLAVGGGAGTGIDSMIVPEVTTNLATDLWVMEEDDALKYVLVRRTAKPVSSLDA